MRSFILALLLVGTTLSLNAQKNSIPKVFEISENDELFESLSSEFSGSLLSVCNDDMDKSIVKWMHFLRSMELYSEEVQYDIRGLKCWFKIFFNANGTIAHLSYSLKPNSININPEELSAFFAGFIKRYKLPVVSSNKFSHYAGASFPTFIQDNDLKE